MKLYRMCRPVSNDKVKVALWSIRCDKSSRVDGFNSLFFRNNWEIVGRDVIEAIKSFF